MTARYDRTDESVAMDWNRNLSAKLSSSQKLIESLERTCSMLSEEVDRFRSELAGKQSEIDALKADLLRHKLALRNSIDSSSHILGAVR